MKSADPPDLAAANKEAIETYIQNLPTMLGIEAEWAPTLAKSYAEGAVTAQEAMAKGMLELQKEYGEEFVNLRLDEFEQVNPGWRDVKQAFQDQVSGNLDRTNQDRLDDRRAIDPQGEEIRGLTADSVTKKFELNDGKRAAGADELLDQTLGDLRLGGELSEDVRREVEQATRRGQSARGNLYGNSAAFEESMNKGLASEARRRDRQNQALTVLNSGLSADNIFQQDLTADAMTGLSYGTSGISDADTVKREQQQDFSNAGAYLAGTTPSNSFAPMASGQTGATPTSNAGYQGGQIFNQGVNAGQQGQQNALNVWNTQVQNDPWATVLGAATGALTSSLMPKP